MIFYRIAEGIANTIDVVHTTREEFAAAHQARRAMRWVLMHWIGWAIDDLPVIRVRAELPDEEMDFEHESLPPTPPETPEREE